MDKIRADKFEMMNQVLPQLRRLNFMAFQAATCIRKMWLGAKTRRKRGSQLPLSGVSLMEVFAAHGGVQQASLA